MSASALRQRSTRDTGTGLKDSSSPTTGAIPEKRKPKRRPAQGETWTESIMYTLPLFGLLALLYYVLHRDADMVSELNGTRHKQGRELDWLSHGERGRTEGHWDFGDGRSNMVGQVWLDGCKNCHWVNTNLGNGG